MGGVGQVKEEFDGVIVTIPSVTVHGDVGIVDQFDLSNSNPIATAIVDANGDQITSFGGGTQYAEGAVPSPITGTAALMEDGGGAMVPLQGDAGNGLLVNLGGNNAVIVTGDVGILDQFDLSNSNPIATAIVDANGDQITSFGGGTQYAEGDTDASIVGTAMMMEVAADTLQPVQGTVADGLLVNLGANNDVTVSGVSTSAKQDTIIGHVDGIEGLLTTIDSDTGALAAVDFATGTDVATLGVTGGGAELGALRVTIANDSTGLVSIDDNGGSITVDNGGTFVVQENGAALTSLQLLDDVVQSTAAAIPAKASVIGISDGTNVQIPRAISSTLNTASLGIQAAGLVAQLDEVSPTTITENQFGVLRLSPERSLYSEIRDAAGNERGVNVNASNELNVAASLNAGTSVIGKVGHDITGLLTGRTEVTTAGTRVVLAGSTACKGVLITAETDNTDIVVVGGTSVVAALATRQGTPLSPGAAVYMPIDNLNDVNLDSIVSTEGVTYTAFT